MVDYNQALTRAEAIRRGRELEKEETYWLEEPMLTRTMRRAPR